MSKSSLMRLAGFYNSNFERRPIPTLVVTNGVLNSIADGIAQVSTGLMQDKSIETVMREYDVNRTLRFAAFGMAMGPLIGRWMRLLERHVPIRPGMNKTLQLAKRVLADQAVMAPIGLTLFVGSMGIMEGRSSDEIGTKFADMYFPALIANWKVWPLIQTINFKLMPIQYRVPFQSTCGIAWTLYLSLLNARDDKKLDQME